MKLLDVRSTVSAVSGATISPMAGIAAVAGAIWLSIVTIGPPPVVVAEVAVPPSLVQRGFTATIMARRLSDETGRSSHSSATERAEAVLF